MSPEVVLSAIGLVTDHMNVRSGNLVYSSDMVTYPKDLEGVGDAVPRTSPAAVISLSEDLSIRFELRGDFRGYHGQGLDDPNPTLWPVMANVFITLGQSSDVMLEEGSELSISFKAMATPYGTAGDPHVRFLCEGHWVPKFMGDIKLGDMRFSVDLDIDQDVNVIVISKEITMGDGVLGDESPNGFSLGIK